MARLPPGIQPLWPYAKALHTVGTGVVSPLTRRLSPWLPRSVALTAEDAVAGGGRLHLARPPEVVHRALPSGPPEVHSRFRAAASVQVPRVAVVELPRGRVVGPHSAVVTDAGQLVWELSSYFGTDRPSRLPVYLQVRTGAPVELPGRVAVLATRGDMNYYHFLLDVLPRLGVLAACPELAPVDRYLVPAATEFQRELLGLAGVAPEQVVDATAHPHVRAQTLVVPGLPSRDLETAPWVVQHLRSTLLGARGSGAGQRLYLTRGRQRNTRRIVNEDAVVAFLHARGFRTVDCGALSVRDQIAAFAAAEVIVAPHGAALANVTFASPGARLVEVFAPDYVNPCYWALASQVPGLDYRYLLGTAQPGARRERAQAGVLSDITVDLDALEEALGVHR